VGETLLVNPGEILGGKGTPSFAIYDTEADKVDFLEIH
jgi:predicted phosphodiesterase